jgi:hypothetical protein
MQDLRLITTSFNPLTGSFIIIIYNEVYSERWSYEKKEDDFITFFDEAIKLYFKHFQISI